MAQDKQPRGEDARLAEWVAEHARAVRGYLLSLVGRPELAEDLAQEVFRRAWQARHRYREQGTPRAYLLKIADRLALDAARRCRPEVHLHETAWRAIEPAAGDGGPAELLEAAETERRLADALESLSPPQRRVLLLRYFGDLSFQEIAETIGCPLATALSHCRRGLLALRKQLAPQAPLP